MEAHGFQPRNLDEDKHCDRTLSETGYIRYMRGLGIVFILAGIAIIIKEVIRQGYSPAG